MRMPSARWWQGLCLGAALAAGSVATWAASRETLPREVHIAGGAHGGMYHRLAALLGERLRGPLDRDVRVLETGGAVANHELLLSGEAHVAVLQLGATPTDGVAALSPLFPEAVHVVVRRGRGIATVEDLAGRDVALGPESSGMRRSAIALLDRYGIAPPALRSTERYFTALLEDDLLDAAVITAGLLNPDLQRVMATGRFRLLPIPNGRALAYHIPSLKPLEIPSGLYGQSPPLPETGVPTVATTAYLAVRSDAPDALVEATLSTLHAGLTRASIPGLIDTDDASRWTAVPLHPAARTWYHPDRAMGSLARLMERLVAFKELMVAFGAGLYLLVSAWRRHRREQSEKRLRTEKDRLDALLDETVRIERAQMHTNEPTALRSYLDETTTLKLRALGELTHEGLRGDGLFSIFLLQCSALSAKIVGKIGLYSASPKEAEPL